MPGRAQAGEGDGQTVTVTRGIPRDIKGYQDRKGSALGQWSPQKKMTSSLPTSSLAVSGVVGSEGPGDAGGRDVLPDLKKASGGVVAGAGLGAGKQGSGREMGHTGVRCRHNQWVAPMPSGQAHLGQVQIRGWQAGWDSGTGGFVTNSHPCS